MANVIKLLRSTTAGAAPSSLVSGQIAINEKDGKFFWLDATSSTLKSFTALNLDSTVSGKLTAASNLSDIANAATARTNLGLGSAATLSSSAVARTANNLSDLANAGTARANLGLGSAATLSSSAILQAANNLSDVADPAFARGNLGLAIGSNVQAWDADLDAIGALIGTSGLLKKTAANTWALDTTSYLSGTVAVANGGTGLTSLTAGYIPFGAGTSAFGNSSNLFWDSANNRLGVGTASPLTNLSVLSGTATGQTPGTGGRILLDGNNGNNWIDIFSSTAGAMGIRFGDSGGAQQGRISYQNSGDFLDFYTNGSERMRIDSAGNVGIGATTLATSKVNLAGTVPANGGQSIAINTAFTIDPASTTNTYFGAYSNPSVSTGTLPTLYHFTATQGTFTGAVTSQYGYVAGAGLTGATNNYGFYSNIASGTGRWNFFANGTANNAFAGNSSFGGVTAPVATVDVTGSVAATTTILSTGATSGVGYATGSGGAVTQATSRTTGVTLNNVCGAITLFSAAGSATYQTFTVTNSAVAATDVIHVSQKSGADKYIIMVTAVAAGSFAITFATTGGTTTEQPVFNFAVIKAVAA